jgi:hypothetical protein
MALLLPARGGCPCPLATSGGRKETHSFSVQHVQLPSLKSSQTQDVCVLGLLSWGTLFLTLLVPRLCCTQGTDQEAGWEGWSSATWGRTVG